MSGFPCNTTYKLFKCPNVSYVAGTSCNANTFVNSRQLQNDCEYHELDSRCTIPAIIVAMTTGSTAKHDFSTVNAGALHDDVNALITMH